MKTSLNLVVSKVIPNVRVLSPFLVAAFMLVFVAACSSPPGTALLDEDDAGEADVTGQKDDAGQKDDSGKKDDSGQKDDAGSQDDVGSEVCVDDCDDINGIEPTPQIDPLSVNGEEADIEIYSGGDVEVAWDSDDVDSCQALGNFPGWSGAKSVFGQEILGTAYELDEGSYTIELSCEAQGQTTSLSRTVTVVDHCQAREALPSDWNHLTTGNNSCSYRAYGLGLPGGNSGRHPDHDCRYFNQVWPWDFEDQTTIQRVLGAPNSNGGRHYVAMQFNTGDLPASGHYGTLTFYPPQSTSLSFGHKHVSISRCPGDFDAAAILADMGPGCLKRTSAAGPRWGGPHFKTAAGVCALEPHTDYYLNIIYTNDLLGTPFEDIQPPPQCIDGTGCGTRIAPAGSPY